MKRIFFDIETRARPEAVALLPEPQAPANYKDAEKIAAYVAEKRAAQLRDAALDPDTGEITAIAVKFTGEEPASVFLRSQFDEMTILEGFWSCMAQVEGRMVGYNILGFDLPFLLRRSLALGVRPYLVPDLRRYQCYPVTDLYGIMYNWQPGKGLKTVAGLLGIPNPLAGLNGADVAGMDDATLREYVVNDVRLVVALYQRMCGVYLPPDDDDGFPF